jgi:MFS family permease
MSDNHAISTPMRHPLFIAMTGMVCLAVAMGIGRFAFTPLLPMMLHDGSIDLQSGSWLATANYLGYWLGAIACALQPWFWRRMLPGRGFSMVWAVRLGLAMTVLLTVAMGLDAPGLWAALRFGAGVASALVFVYTSGWCLARLAAAGAPRLGGVIYVGPGLGIVVSGLSASAMVNLQVSASTAWVVFGALALALSLLVWGRFSSAPSPSPIGAAAGWSAGPGQWPVALLVLAYGLAGFGYIITATFLPVIARQALPGSAWLDLFWPLFGLAVAVGALLTTRLPEGWDRRHLLIACYLTQAVGVMLAVWWPTLAGFALGSVLLGVPFTAISLFAMQEVRRVRPHAAAAYMGVLTAAYGLGQIAGPALVAHLLQRVANVSAGFVLSLEIAAASLVLGALLFGWLVRVSPLATKTGVPLNA